ncbi:unnamed protein product [Durusdinium trenchii]|uniref:Uncharacterized protein n=1 Tax=Durusdinium trenchii TaxID=1381693 RepID=A0ABP0JS47_9DINO
MATKCSRVDFVNYSPRTSLIPAAALWFSPTTRRSATRKCFAIPKTEERGITLEQLRRLPCFISKMAEHWCETFGEHRGRQLHFKTFNLYHADYWITKPATNGYGGHGCSLVEVMAVQIQRPHWFVSHAWIAHVLTDGLAGAESRMIDIVGLRQKSVRERGFPTSILEQGLEVKIEEASATEQEDKVRILNSIAFPRLNTQELKDSQSNPLAHPNYERVDKALASHFALASWRGFVLQGKQTEALARALRLDDGRKVVQLSFTGCQHFSDSELKRLLENLPGDLDLGFSALETWDCVKTDRFPFAKSLDQLELRFTGSSSFRSAAGLADLLREMENLVDLELWFMNLPGLEELGSLNAAFLSLRNLENLVDLSGCGQVSEVRTELHQSIRSLKRRGSSLDLWINIEGLPSRRCGLRFCPRRTWSRRLHAHRLRRCGQQRMHDLSTELHVQVESMYAKHLQIDVSRLFRKDGDIDMHIQPHISSLKDHFIEARTQFDKTNRDVCLPLQEFLQTRDFTSGPHVRPALKLLAPGQEDVLLQGSGSHILDVVHCGVMFSCWHGMIEAWDFLNRVR